MKTGLTKKQKVTEVYFDERDDIAEIHTHNTELKKRLAAYAKKYPKLCKQTDDDEQGGVRYEIDKHRISIHLVPPYSKERRKAASEYAKQTANYRTHNKEVAMEKYIYNEQNGLHYELVGDYYLPLLTVPEAPPLGIWGRRRHRYLKEHRPVIYNTMLLSGELFSYLAEVDQQAKDLHDRLMQQLAAQAGITEQLKAQDQMAWVQQMNTIDAQVREIINADLIYA